MSILTEIQAATGLGAAPAQVGAAGSPTPDAIKAGAKAPGQLGQGVPGGQPPAAKNVGGRPRKDGTPAGSKAAPAAAPAAEQPAVQPFIWNEQAVGQFGKAIMGLPYAALGPAHAHWNEAEKGLQSSGAYANWAYILNRLQISDPLYALVAVAIIQTTEVMLQAGVKSYKIVQTEKAQAAARLALEQAHKETQEKK